MKNERSNFPKLHPGIWDGVVVLVIVLLALLLIVGLFRDRGTEHLTAVVYIDGDEKDRVELSGKFEERVYSGHSYSLTTQFCPDNTLSVQVISANCPTQDCVHTGRISRNGQSIICLPARIIIRLEGNEEISSDAPDVVIG